MPLTPPNLDDRDFETLYQQARARIPNYLPEWTDLNESDPGVALLQLQTWLVETILNRLNRLPELNYYKFLKLIGVKQRPATAATARVTFDLDEKKLSGWSEIDIPKATLLRVSSRDLPEPVYFETDESLTAIAARLERLLVAPPRFGGPSVPPEEVTLDNMLDNQSFLPFGDLHDVKDFVTSPSLLLGFHSEAPMTRHEFGLYVYLKDEPLGPLAAARADDCGPEVTGGDSGVPALHWEWWDGAGWYRLVDVRDETADLRRSGPIYLRIPGQIPAVPDDAVTGMPMTPPIDLKDVLPPGLAADEATRTLILGKFAGSSPPIKTFADVAKQQPDALCELLKDNLQGADDEKKALVLAMIMRAQHLATARLFYWLRVTYDPAVIYEPSPPEIERILTNTVGVTQAQTMADEVAGSSNGMPNQIMRLRHAPVLQPRDEPPLGDEPPLLLEIDEGEGPVVWEAVPDFAASKPNARHYLLDRTSGEIHFGDNRFGKIPRAGQANIIARKYRYGGGRTGNVGARTIKELVRPVGGVKEVFNLTAATGGEDEEPLAETMLRVPRALRANQRAVTLDDFAQLARETPGAQVVRSYAYIPRDPVVEPGPEHCRTRIHVVVLPRLSDPRPSPNETTIRMVCRYLDERRLVTTQVIVEGPTYEDVAVELRVKVQPTVDRGTARAAVDKAVRSYLDPYEGGPNRQGWPFGRDIFYSEMLREVMAVSGVLRVESLKLLRLAGIYEQEDNAKNHPPPHDDPCLTMTARDVKNLVPDAKAEKPWAALETYNCCDLPVAEGALVSLFHIDLQVDYDRSGG